jgi:hypothetical protein
MNSGASLGFLACRRLVRNLHEVPKLTEIRHDENDERMISQGTEDGMYSLSSSGIVFNFNTALKLDTLHKLTESPSYELRGACVFLLFFFAFQPV